MDTDEEGGRGENSVGNRDRGAVLDRQGSQAETITCSHLGTLPCFDSDGEICDESGGFPLMLRGDRRAETRLPRVPSQSVFL